MSVAFGWFLLCYPLVFCVVIASTVVSEAGCSFVVFIGNGIVWRDICVFHHISRDFLLLCLNVHY